MYLYSVNGQTTIEHDNDSHSQSYNLFSKHVNIYLFERKHDIWGEQQHQQPPKHQLKYKGKRNSLDFGFPGWFSFAMAIGDMLAIESNGLARTQSRGGQFFLLEIRPSLRFSIYASDVNVIIFIPEKGRGEKEIGY